MQTKVLFGGEPTAVSCFGKMLESRQVTFGFPGETSQWTIALGESSDIANALLQTLSLNPEVEAELKRGGNAIIATWNDGPDKIEQALSKGTAPTLTFKMAAS